MNLKHQLGSEKQVTGSSVNRVVGLEVEILCKYEFYSPTHGTTLNLIIQIPTHSLLMRSNPIPAHKMSLAPISSSLSTSVVLQVAVTQT